VHYAARINGLSALAVTKLDVLDTLDRIGLCTGYEIDGTLHTEFPGEIALLERAVPRYEWFEGWRTPTSAARTMQQLPAQARKYLDRIAQLVGAPINFVSTGTRRDQIIGL
jgi:adenylosuccinate synthase